jgi:hypothetical protein
VSQFAGNRLQKGVPDTQDENCRLFFNSGVMGEFVPVNHVQLPEPTGSIAELHLVA